MIVERIIMRWGLMHEIQSDQGPEFQADLSLQLYDILGIDNVRSIPYRPQTNGAIERWHSVLHSLMAKVASENQTDWSQCLPYVTFCHNCTTHTATGFARHVVLRGMNPRRNIDLLLNDKAHEAPSVHQYTAELLARLYKVHSFVREHLGQIAESASRWYHRRVRPETFQVGELVRVFNPRKFVGGTPKWTLHFRETAWVEKCLNDSTYMVRPPKWKSSKIVHVDKLKREHVLGEGVPSEAVH